jgi:hypothetical protein
MVPLEQIDLAFRPEPSFNSLVKNSSITEEGYPNTVCYDPAQKIVYACGLDLFLHQSTKNGAIGTWTNSPFATTSSVLRSVTRTDNGDVFAFDEGKVAIFVVKNFHDGPEIKRLIVIVSVIWFCESDFQDALAASYS